MQIAKKDGSGVDALGIRRLIFAGQPIPPGLEVDKSLVSDDEIGHFNPVTQGDHVSEATAANNEAVVTAQQHRSDIEGNLLRDDDAPLSRPGVGPESVDPDTATEADSESDELTGEDLRERAAELDIKGRSKMSADELRDAVAEAEAAEVEEVDE